MTGPSGWPGAGLAQGGGHSNVRLVTVYYVAHRTIRHSDPVTPFGVHCAPQQFLQPEISPLAGRPMQNEKFIPGKDASLEHAINSMQAKRVAHGLGK
jgi:hypothetical protein